MKLITSWLKINRTLTATVAIILIFCALSNFGGITRTASAASKPRARGSITPKVISQSVFKIGTLTANNVTAIDAASQISDDRGGIAVSTTKAFLTGDGNTGIWDRSNLANPGFVGAVRDGIVMDIDSQKVYTFADSDGNPVPTSLNPGTFTISKLVQLDSDTGGLTATDIDLSSPITINASSSSSANEAGVFSGYDRIVVVDATSGGGTAYNIDLPSGNVTNIGTVTASNYAGRSPAENWATWGSRGILQRRCLYQLRRECRLSASENFAHERQHERHLRDRRFFAKRPQRWTRVHGRAVTEPLVFSL